MADAGNRATAPRYRTIVADPPWEYRDGFPVSPAGKAIAARRGLPVWSHKPLPYPQMTVEELKALPVRGWAESDAHLYLWTTNRYLRDAFDVMQSWGFRFAKTIVWCKAPRGLGPGGTWAQTTEYILFGRRGNLPTKARYDTNWFAWKRQARHSQKPEAFLDMVESVSPGPYLELFARRNRLGWDTWGDEALEHVEMDA